jgi:predicted nucleic acid-binding protein
MNKVFVDTNILVYTMDQGEPRKRDLCRELLKRRMVEDRLVISTQVMQEFFVAATRKLGADPSLVKDVLHRFERFEVVQITPARIEQAIDCSILHRISFWDALIVTAAEEARCVKVLSEDLGDGRMIRGVTIENPLRDI